MFLSYKYADKIYGIITCYDRMIIQGYIPSRLRNRSALMPSASQTKTGLKLNSSTNSGLSAKMTRFRKSSEQPEKQKGLSISFLPWSSAALINHGMIRPPGRHSLSFCYLRVPTWSPFRLQFYMNGHNLLAHKLQKKGISYRMHDNAFLEISDVEAAPKLSDRINPEDLHKILDAFAKRYSPVHENPGPGYTWTLQQIECATDIMFKQPGDLEPLYDEIVRTAIFTVKPDNTATF